MFDLTDNIKKLTKELKDNIDLSKEDNFIFTYCDNQVASFGWLPLTLDPAVYDNNTLVKMYYRTIGSDIVFFFVGLSFKENIIRGTKYLILENSLSEKCPAFLVDQAGFMYTIKQQTATKPS